VAEKLLLHVATRNLIKQYRFGEVRQSQLLADFRRLAMSADLQLRVKQSHLTAGAKNLDRHSMHGHRDILTSLNIEVLDISVVDFLCTPKHEQKKIFIN
jgi:hypothetical protein